MKKIIFIIFILGLYSCKNTLDKSIFQPLTTEELKNEIDKDSTFQWTYKYINYIKDTILKSDIERTKYVDLTYKRIQKFEKFTMDTIYFNPINKKLTINWKKKYGKYQIKVDSISKYWKNYKLENSLEQFVKIEIVEIYKIYYSYSYDIKKIYIGFKLTPLKGDIQQISFGYNIEPKLDEDINKEESIYSDIDKSWCFSTTPFSRSIILYCEANYTNEKHLKNESIKTFNRDYNIYIKINKLRKDGKNINNCDLNIPESIQNYWKYENKVYYIKDLYVKDVVKEILNEEYLLEYEYNNQEINKILKNKDDLSFNFLNLLSVKL